MALSRFRESFREVLGEGIQRRRRALPEFWHGDCEVDFSAHLTAHTLQMDWAKAPDPADSDVHVTGIAASSVDVFFCLAESASVRGFRCTHIF